MAQRAAAPPIICMETHHFTRSKAARTIRLSPEDLATCRFGLAQAWPERSAARRLTGAQAGCGLLLIGLLAAAARWTPAALHAFLAAGWTLLFAAAILLRIASAAMLLARPGRPPPPWQGPLPVYTVLCPLLREAGEVARLLAAIDALDYPKHKLDVKLLLEADDAATIAAARRHAPAHAELVILAPCNPRTKPKALNAGLMRAHGRFLTVYDAEDAPDSRQLLAALAAFQAGGSNLACVQAPLLIDNAGGSWLAAQFALEYALQFLGLNPLLARLGLAFPLGGTSNHFRTEALRSVGGWDAFNVTEDADVGYRLVRDGWALGVIAPPTWEEAPLRLWPWLRQRSRWIKGHLQTALVLLRNPRALWRELGWRQSVALGASFGLGLASSFAHGPLLLWTLWSLASGTAPAWALALLLAGGGAAWLAGIAVAARRGSLRLAAATLGMAAYWPLASVASAMAVWGLCLRPFHWAKTQHGFRGRRQPQRLRLLWTPPAAQADRAQLSSD